MQFGRTPFGRTLMSTAHRAMNSNLSVKTTDKSLKTAPKRVPILRLCDVLISNSPVMHLGNVFLNTYLSNFQNLYLASQRGFQTTISNEIMDRLKTNNVGFCLENNRDIKNLSYESDEKYLIRQEIVRTFQSNNQNMFTPEELDEKLQLCQSLMYPIQFPWTKLFGDQKKPDEAKLETKKRKREVDIEYLDTERQEKELAKNPRTHSPASVIEQSVNTDKIDQLQKKFEQYLGNDPNAKKAVDLALKEINNDIEIDPDHYLRKRIDQFKNSFESDNDLTTAAVLALKAIRHSAETTVNDIPQVIDLTDDNSVSETSQKRKYKHDISPEEALALVEDKDDLSVAFSHISDKIDDDISLAGISIGDDISISDLSNNYNPEEIFRPYQGTV